VGPPRAEVTLGRSRGARVFSSRVVEIGGGGVLDCEDSSGRRCGFVLAVPRALGVRDRDSGNRWHLQTDRR
jgi:hypothetical protein